MYQTATVKLAITVEGGLLYVRFFQQPPRGTNSVNQCEICYLT